MEVQIDFYQPMGVVRTSNLLRDAIQRVLVYITFTKQIKQVKYLEIT